LKKLFYQRFIEKIHYNSLCELSNVVMYCALDIDPELEHAFLAKWKYLDLIRPLQRMSWEEASLIWNAAVSEYVLAAYPDIEPNLVKLITAYCGNGRDNFAVRSIVYLSTRAAQRQDTFLNVIRYPRPLYEDREIEPALIRPVRALQILCCCTWIYAIVISILFCTFAILFQPIAIYGMSVLQFVWLFEDCFTESFTRLPGKLVCWVFCFLGGNFLLVMSIGLWAMILCSYLLNLMTFSMCCEIPDMDKGIYYLLYNKLWTANLSIFQSSIERRKHPVEIWIDNLSEI